jgi:drug/metabolite transporter (DMT)-like permease
MRGLVLAAVGGVAFGFFQAANTRAGRAGSPYVTTFSVLAVSVVTLWTITLVTADAGVLVGAPRAALAWFAGACLVHYFLGWTFLSLSQRGMGAARTGAIVGTTPLFGTLVAFLALGESVRAAALAGVALVVVGTVTLALRGSARDRTGARGARASVVFALLTAACWGTSPIFIRLGLEQLRSPLIGVSVGLSAATLAYGAVLVTSGRRRALRIPPQARSWVLFAGVVAAFAIATQWAALDLAPVAPVVALNQLAVPTVLLLAPLLVGGAAERLTRRTVIGTACTVAGTLVIIFSRSPA